MPSTTGTVNPREKGIVTGPVGMAMQGVFSWVCRPTSLASKEGGFHGRVAKATGEGEGLVLVVKANHAAYSREWEMVIEINFEC